MREILYALKQEFVGRGEGYGLFVPTKDDEKDTIVGIGPVDAIIDPQATLKDLVLSIKEKYKGARPQFSFDRPDTIPELTVHLDSHLGVHRVIRYISLSDNDRNEFINEISDFCNEEQPYPIEY